MSTVEDFENAPVGATATHKVTGIRAMKMDAGERCWIFPSGLYVDGELMERWDYTLDRPAPTTVREALDLAWELAHEVKEGQVIPKGTRYVRSSQGGRLATFTATEGWTPTPRNAEYIRTLDPLPEPEPDWLDAPAVIAVCWYCETETLHALPECGNRWKCAECHTSTPWRSLTEVTPLYPEEGQAT